MLYGLNKLLEIKVVPIGAVFKRVVDGVSSLRH